MSPLHFTSFALNPIESMRSILFYAFFITLLPTHLISKNSSNPLNSAGSKLQMSQQEIQKKLNNGVSPKELINLGAKTDLFMGLRYQGGMIFNIDDSGKGLMAALADHSEMAPWSCKGFSVSGANETHKGSGRQNTEAILNDPCQSNDGVISAAEICAQFKGGNHNDWFLPSIDELNEMYLTIGQGSDNNLGGFKDANYWSSTEHDPGTAFMQQFVNGSQGPDLKTFKVRVRAIRSF